MTRRLIYYLVDGVEALSQEASIVKTFEVAMEQIRSSWADLDLADDGARWRCNLSLPLFGEVRTLQTKTLVIHEKN